MDKAIEEILDWFDFDKVHRAMESLNWVWHNSESDTVPFKAELRQHARKLIKEVWGKPKGQCVSCGGFKATSYGESKVSLEFVIASWDYGVD